MSSVTTLQCTRGIKQWHHCSFETCFLAKNHCKHCQHQECMTKMNSILTIQCSSNLVLSVWPSLDSNVINHYTSGIRVASLQLCYSWHKLSNANKGQMCQCLCHFETAPLLLCFTAAATDTNWNRAMATKTGCANLAQSWHNMCGLTIIIVNAGYV